MSWAANALEAQAKKAAHARGSMVRPSVYALVDPARHNHPDTIGMICRFHADRLPAVDRTVRISREIQAHPVIFTGTILQRIGQTLK